MLVSWLIDLVANSLDSRIWCEIADRNFFDSIQLLLLSELRKCLIAAVGVFFFVVDIFLSLDSVIFLGNLYHADMGASRWMMGDFIVETHYFHQNSGEVLVRSASMINPHMHYWRDIYLLIVNIAHGHAFCTPRKHNLNTSAITSIACPLHFEFMIEMSTAMSDDHACIRWPLIVYLKIN